MNWTLPDSSNPILLSPVTLLHIYKILTDMFIRIHICTYQYISLKQHPCACWQQFLIRAYLSQTYTLHVHMKNTHCAKWGNANPSMVTHKYPHFMSVCQTSKSIHMSWHFTLDICALICMHMYTYEQTHIHTTHTHTYTQVQDKAYVHTKVQTCWHA